MPKAPGSEKTGGRKKGTPNKRTVELKEILNSLDTHVPTRILELLPQLPPAKQVDVLLQLMPYLYPKRKPVEHTPPQASQSRVLLMIPSNGREAPGQQLNTPEEVDRIKRDERTLP